MSSSIKKPSQLYVPNSTEGTNSRPCRTAVEFAPPIMGSSPASLRYHDWRRISAILPRVDTKGLEVRKNVRVTEISN